MNIEYANTIPMREILAKLGLLAVQEHAPLYIYPSPFRKDNAPTLHVNDELNIWFDSEASISGNSVEFLKAFLKLDDLPCSHVDAIDWLKVNIGYPSLLEGINLPDEQTDGSPVFKYQACITSAVLVRYLDRHYIPLSLARKLFVEIGYTKGKKRKEVYALGVKTICEGYAVQSPHINAFIGVPGITVIRPDNANIPAHIRGADKPKVIHVFKDSFDYLTVLCIDKKLFSDSEVIILHDYSLLDQSANYIRGFSPALICTWFDNGKIGKLATKNYAFMCSILENTKHYPQNWRYASADDVNAHFITIAEAR